MEGVIILITSLNIRYSNLEGVEYIRPIVVPSVCSFDSFFWQKLVRFWWMDRCLRSMQWHLYAWYWYVICL